MWTLARISTIISLLKWEKGNVSKFGNHLRTKSRVSKNCQNYGNRNFLHVFYSFAHNRRSWFAFSVWTGCWLQHVLSDSLLVGGDSSTMLRSPFGAQERGKGGKSRWEDKIKTKKKQKRKGKKKTVKCVISLNEWTLRASALSRSVCCVRYHLHCAVPSALLPSP